MDQSFQISSVFSDAALTDDSGLIVVFDKDSKIEDRYLRTNFKHLRILWRTYFQEVDREKHALGFRILAYPSGKTDVLEKKTRWVYFEVNQTRLRKCVLNSEACQAILHASAKPKSEYDQEILQSHTADQPTAL